MWLQYWQLQPSEDGIYFLTPATWATLWLVLATERGESEAVSWNAFAIH